MSFEPKNAGLPFGHIWGVDFSGARLAGRYIWLARCEVTRGRLRLVELDSLESLCGTAEREAALAWLVRTIRGSRSALWAIDFPFGLPVEIFPPGASWQDQLEDVARHGGQNGAADAGPNGARADEYGRECVRRAKLLGGAMHLFRVCDRAARTPFDCYHYRIIYQTFHGMRDVLRPLRGTRGTAIGPFDAGYFGAKFSGRGRVVIEACPSSTLKHLKLPYQNYKQPTGGALEPRRLRTRKTILAGIGRHIEIGPGHLRKIMRNPGGDALDAVIAAAGAWLAWRNNEHSAIAGHPRHSREGFVYFG
jgi:hypothetical protein